MLKSLKPCVKNRYMGGGTVIYANDTRDITIKMGKNIYPIKGLPKAATLPTSPSETIYPALLPASTFVQINLLVQSLFLLIDISSQ